MGETNDKGKGGLRLVGLIFGGSVFLGLGVGFLIHPEPYGILAGLFAGSGLGFILLGWIWLKYGQW